MPCEELSRAVARNLAGREGKAMGGLQHLIWAPINYISDLIGQQMPNVDGQITNVASIGVIP
jgi:hypothetical protein